jgi:hypothetical protein
MTKRSEKTTTDKFNKVPLEDDTVILFQTEAKLGKYDILYQKWFWDGITAESIIFADEDVNDLEEEEIIKEVKASPLLKNDSKITFKRSGTGYTFVNFNFETE